MGSSRVVELDGARAQPFRIEAPVPERALVTIQLAEFLVIHGGFEGDANIEYRAEVFSSIALLQIAMTGRRGFPSSPVDFPGYFSQSLDPRALGIGKLTKAGLATEFASEGRLSRPFGKGLARYGLEEGEVAYQIPEVPDADALFFPYVE